MQGRYSYGEMVSQVLRTNEIFTDENLCTYHVVEPRI